MEVLVTQSCLCLYFTKLTYRSLTRCKLHPAPGPYLPGVTTPVAFCISERSQDNKPERGGLRCVQSGLTLWCHMDCIPLGSSVQGLFQERILEWVAVPFSKGSSPPRGQNPQGRGPSDWKASSNFFKQCKKRKARFLRLCSLSHTPGCEPHLYDPLKSPTEGGTVLESLATAFSPFLAED